MHQDKKILQRLHCPPRRIQFVAMRDLESSSAENEDVEVVSTGHTAMQPTPPIRTMASSRLLETPDIPAMTSLPREKQQPTWKGFLITPVVKVMVGLLIGIGLLFLVSRFVNIPAAFTVLQQHLTTPRGILLALLSGLAFLLAYCVRGMRWKLFLNSIGQVSTFKAIRLFLIGVFINFLLPVQGGEVAKSLMLKRNVGIPISRSLPTVAMDKSLDLLPALFIIAIVPFLDVRMDIKLWLVLGTVSALLIGIVFFIALAAWKRSSAIHLLHKIMGMLPRSLGGKAEGFAIGFVDALLLAASRPRTFLFAFLLTCVAVSLDSLYAMLAFWTIGYPISYGTILFGYTVFNMFYILPNPPGQVGSNEAVGLLVFTGLLHIPPDKVLAMIVFAHPWTALLMSISGMACLSSLGLTFSNAIQLQKEGKNVLLQIEKQKVLEEQR